MFSWRGSQLSSSVQAAPKWRFRSDFPSCPESAEIWHVYSFCVKKCPCFFFHKWGSNASTPPPPPPPPPPLPLCSSPNNVKFRSLRAKTLCMCLLRYWREIEGGGGGWTFKNVFEALLSNLATCGKKNTGTFLNTKRVDMPNFSWFGATWKIATKSSFRAGLHVALQL